MLIVDPLTGEMVPHSVCSFGLTEIIVPALISLGVGAETAAGVASAVIGATELGAGGAALGGGVNAITGKPILPGIIQGGLTGAAIGGLGPAVGGGLGIGAGAGEVLVGAGAGALGGEITGQNPLSGAIGGAISGGVAGLSSGGFGDVFGGTGGAAAPASGVTGSSAGVSAAGTAAPSSATSSVSLGLDQSAAPGASFTTGGGGGGGDALSLINPPAAPPGMGGAADPVSGGVIGVPPNASTGAFSPSTGQPSSFFGSLFGGGEGTSGGNTAGSLGGIFGGGGGGGDSGGGIGSLLKSYGAPLVAAGGIGMDLLKGQTPLPGQSALTHQADELATQGRQLGSYLQTGTLPPGVHQSLNAAAESAKAAIRSKYAQMGGNTSAMQQDLAHVDQVAATQGVQIATQLLQQGVSETGLSEQIYSQLLNLSLQQNSGLSQSIGSFATALAGGRPVVLQQQGNNA